MELPQVLEGDDINQERPFFGMIDVLIKSADWMHNRLLMIQYGIFGMFFEVIHSANDRIRHTKNIQHIIQILKEVTVPHFVLLAEFLGIPIGEFKQQFNNVSTTSNWYNDQSSDLDLNEEDTNNVFRLSNSGIKIHPEVSYHEYDKMILSHLDNAYNITNIIIESLQVTTEILENNPSVYFLFSLQELLLNLVRKILSVYRKGDTEKLIQMGGHKVLLYSLSWPLEHKQLVTSTEGGWDNLDFNLLDQKRMTKYYDLRTLSLQTICEGITNNPGFLEKISDIGFFEYMIQLELWLIYFFSFDVNGDHQTRIQTWRENINTNSISPETPEQEKIEASNSEATDFITYTEGYHPKNTPIISPGFTKKIVNKKILNIFNMINTITNKLKCFEIDQGKGNNELNIIPSHTDFSSLQVWNCNKQQIPLIFLKIFSDANTSTESIFYLDARRKMKLYTDFQFYFLDQIVLYSSYRNGIDLFISNGLYDIFFSEYFYFFGGQANIVNKCENIKNNINNILNGIETPVATNDINLNLTNLSFVSEKFQDIEKEEMSQITSDSLRYYVLQIIKYIASNTENQEVSKDNADLTIIKNLFRILLSTLAEHSSNPQIVIEIGKAFLEIIDHRYDAIQSILQDLNAFSIASFILQEQLNLQKTIEEFTSNRSEIIIEGISNIELLQKVQEARNTFLSLISLFLTYETNLKLMLDDQNTLNSLFSCLFDPKLRTYGLEHLKKLTNLEVEDSELFSSLVNAYISTMKKIVESPIVDSVHLLMIMLKVLQSSLELSPKFTEQFRNYFDDFISLLNMNPESILNSGMSAKEFIWLMLKNLNLVLYSSSKHFLELENKLKSTFPLMTNHLFGVPHSTTLEDRRTMNASPQILHDLMDLMVDGKFSVENRFIIRNSFVLPLMFPFAMNYDEKIFSTFIQDFTKIVEKSPRNRDMCCQVGLVGVILDMVEEVEKLFDSSKSFNRISDYVLRLLEILGKHSINVKEFKSLFHLLKRQSENVTSPLLNMLFRCLQGMSNYTPSTYFNFDLPKSGLTFPRLEKYPSNGYTLSAWVRLLSLEDLEDRTTINEQYHHRFLFCILNDKGKSSLEIYFQREGQNNRLHINSKKDTSFSYQFEEGKWYHISISHSKGVYIFSKPELKLYVNGVQEDKLFLKYPSHTSTIIASIGHKHMQNSQVVLSTKATQFVSTSLFGNVGAFHFFEDVLTVSQIAQIYALGPQYLSYFDPNDADSVLSQKFSIFDGYLQNKLLISVNARAQICGVCLNIAFPRSLAAIKETQFCASQNAKDILGCLGGMKVLFPLFFRIDKLSHSEQSADSLDPYLVNSIICLTLDMLRNHKDNMDDMNRWKGFQVIGYLLKLISPQHRTQQTVKLIPTIISTVSDSQDLMDQVIKYILFDFKVWIHTHQEVQIALLDRLKLEVKTNKYQQQINFRKLGVRYIMDMMRMFYWVEMEDISLGQGQICNPITNQVLGERPNPRGVIEIRQKVIQLLNIIMQGAPTYDEIEVFVRFLTDCNDSFQLRDILQFLLELIIHEDSAIANVEFLIQAGGFEVLVSLLSKQNEDIIELAIKCIGQILLTNAKIRQKYSMDQSYGFSYIKVLISTYPITERIYRALRNLAMGVVSLNDRDHIEETQEDQSRKLKKFQSTTDISTPTSCVFISILELLQLVPPDLLLGLLKDFKSKIELQIVQQSIIKQERWQYYLLKLMSTVAMNKSFTFQEIISIHKTIMDIIARCLYHALKNIKQGFKLVEETCAYVFFLAEEQTLSYRDVIGGIYDRILTLFVDGVKNSEMQIIRVNDSSLFDNFLHFTSLIEEHLFHCNSITQSLFSNWKKKKKTFTLALARTPVNDDEEETTQSTQRKLSNGTPIVNLLVEDELNLGEGNVWKDSSVAGKLLSLLFHWELLSIASFASQNKNISAQKSLREGGVLRIALRLIKHLMIYNIKIKSNHLKYLEQIVKMDIELEKEFQQLSELWVVTGELKKTDDYHDRVMYILQFLCDAYDRMDELKNIEDATKVLNCIRNIFSLRRSLLEKTLKDQSDSPLDANPNRFPFFLKRSITSQDYKFIQHGKVWRYIREKYFLEASKKFEKQEEDFLQPLTRKFRSLLNDIAKKSSVYEEAMEKTMCTHQEEVKRTIEPIRLKEYAHIRNEKIKYDEEERINAVLWREIMRDVSNERGAWGNPELPTDTKWILDKVENKHRMRIKLKRDYRDITHEGAAMSNHDPNLILGQIENSSSESKSKAKNNEITMIPRLAIRKEQNEENENEIMDEDAEKDTPGINDSEDTVTETGATGSVQEKTLLKYACEILTPMQGFSGIFELTTKRIIITVDKENKIEMGSDILKTRHLQKPPSDKIIPLEKIKEMHPRRYQLMNTGIEFFFINQKNLMINFKKEERGKVFKKIIALKPPNLIRMNKIRSPAENIARSNITKLWQKRFISNFDYLMELNTFANRTFNDLSQYPVFPWILVDYTSSTIDLNDQRVYRDLSKPIGALNPDRILEIDTRYDMIDDPTMEKFHYGSHYSSPGIVLYYLVRMEPYTTYLRILQGGKFDHADRMFDSIPQTWNNTQHSTDYKELIPEFFYNPEFLTMTNKVNLGFKANGRQLGNALLPPWAKDANDFITVNRRALESEYVSQHLHEWVDLIFGYKQRGPEAVKAKNVFFYLTYEGKVDFDKIDSEMNRRAIISQIQNFGQTPSQLFKKPHLARDPYEPLPLSLSQKVENVTGKDMKSNSSIVYIAVVPSQEKLICISHDAQIFNLKFSFSTAQMGDILKKGSIEFPFSNDIIISRSLFSYSSNLKDAVFSCGHWDFSLRFSRPLLIQNSSSFVGHWRQRDVVTCVTLSENDEYLVSGSKDTTVLTWSIDKNGNIARQPENILYGHDDEVTCVAVSSDLDVVVSGGKDGTMIVHTLRSGKYSRTIRHPSGLAITSLALDGNTGRIVAYSRNDNRLYLYTINGKLLFSVEATKENHKKSSRYGRHIYQLNIQGERIYHDGCGEDIYVRDLDDLSIVQVVNTPPSIRSFTIAEGFAFIGFASGNILVKSGPIFRTNSTPYTQSK